jgi:hypothetical protein
MNFFSYLCSMIEFIKHIFGFCGEGHPSLIYLLGSGPLIAIGIYFKQIYFYLSIMVKSCLRYFGKKLHRN